MRRPKEWNTRSLLTVAAQGLAITVIASSLAIAFTSSPDTWQQLRQHVKWSYLPLLTLPILLSWGCIGTRMYLMCRCLGHRLSFRRALSIAVCTEFGIAATPSGVGGTAIRLGFLKKAGVSFVHGGSLLAADLAMDLLFFALILPFSVSALMKHVHLDPDEMAQDGPSPWFALLAAPVALILLRKRLFRFFRRQKTARRYRLGARIRLGRAQLLHGIRQGRTAMALIFRQHRGHLVLNLLLSALQFTSRYSILPLVLMLLGVEVDPLSLIVMQGVLFMLSVSTVVPGGGGGVEILAALALPQFMPVHLIGVAILLWRLFTYHFYLLFGGLFFAATFKRLMRSQNR